LRSATVIRTIANGDDPVSEIPCGMIVSSYDGLRDEAYVVITRGMNVSNASAAYLESLAFSLQSGEPPVAFDHSKRLLNEYLNSLKANNLKGHWKTEGYRFIVTAELEDTTIGR